LWACNASRTLPMAWVKPQLCVPLPLERFSNLGDARAGATTPRTHAPLNSSQNAGSHPVQSKQVSWAPFQNLAGRSAQS
jgi:hypothetical protein